MKQEINIHIACTAELLCIINSEDEFTTFIETLPDSNNNMIIVGVTSTEIVLKMGQKVHDYPVKLYGVTKFENAYSLLSLKKLINHEHQAEALANDIIAINDINHLPEEIITRVKSLISTAQEITVEPLSRMKILMNFISICCKRGMSLSNPFNIYTMDMNNCYLITGTEAGEQ